MQTGYDFGDVQECQSVGVPKPGPNLVSGQTVKVNSTAENNSMEFVN